ncbi:hypothetical protein TSH64_01050 [Azospirillum sp. TSH64]|nr:hypothetical protein TSH64_01050 [Azospirillum sp. TSH64]
MGQYADKLASVEAAIKAVEERGQRVVIKDRELWRADLDRLYAERKRLEPLARRETRGGLRMRRIVPL